MCLSFLFLLNLSGAQCLSWESGMVSIKIISQGWSPWLCVSCMYSWRKTTDPGGYLGPVLTPWNSGLSYPCSRPSLLRDARGKGYQIQNPAEFYVLFQFSNPISFMFRGPTLSCPDTKRENMCSYHQYNRKGTGLRFKRPEFYPLQFLPASCKVLTSLFSCL